MKTNCVITGYSTIRLIFTAKTSDHITPLTRELHRLRIRFWLWFRLCVLSVGILVEFRSSVRNFVVLVVTPTNRSTLGDRAFSAAVTTHEPGMMVRLRRSEVQKLQRPHSVSNYDV